MADTTMLSTAAATLGSGLRFSRLGHGSTCTMSQCVATCNPPPVNLRRSRYSWPVSSRSVAVRGGLKGGLRLPGLGPLTPSGHLANCRFVARAAHGRSWAWGACFSRRRKCVLPTYAPSGRLGGHRDCVISPLRPLARSNLENEKERALPHPHVRERK